MAQIQHTSWYLPRADTGCRLLSAAVLLSLFAMQVAWGEAADSPAIPTSESDSRGDDSLFEQLNRDGNDSISPGEVAEEHRRLFDRMLRTSDKDGNGVLDRGEFIDATTPRRPPKPLESRQPTEFPGANALRVLVYRMDADGDYILAKNEIPERLQRVFDEFLQIADADKNARLDRLEITRAGPRLSRVAMRAANRAGIDVDREVGKVPAGLLRPQDTDRRPRRPVELLRNPEHVARLFARFDADGDGRLSPSELPAEAQRRYRRLFRAADRNGDGSVSREEIAAASRRHQRPRDKPSRQP